MPLFKVLVVYMERLKRQRLTQEEEITGIYQVLALPEPSTEDDNRYSQ